MFIVGIQGILTGQEEKQSNGIIQIPCNEASWEGEGYYRGCGIGEALDVPESMIEARVGAVQDVLIRAFFEFFDAVEKSLGDCVCIDTCRLSDGNYQTIIVYDVPKDTLMVNMATAINSVQQRINQFREIDIMRDFDIEKFRNVMEDEMKKYLQQDKVENEHENK